MSVKKLYVPTRWLVLLYLASLFLFSSVTQSAESRSASEIAKSYGPLTRYDIYRNGKLIGKHTLAFDKTASTLTASVESNIRIRILGLTVYKLNYKAEEQWEDNRLVSAVATTTENGKSSSVSLQDSSSPDRPLFASNHWHRGVLSADTVFNTLTGEASVVTVEKLGVETVQTSAGEISSTHYRYSDEIEADVWYDSSGLWVKLAFSGDDGSSISYVRY